MSFIKGCLFVVLLLCGGIFVEKVIPIVTKDKIKNRMKNKRVKRSILLLAVYLVFVFDTAVCLGINSDLDIKNIINNNIYLNGNTNSDESKVIKGFFYQNYHDVVDQSLSDDDDDDDEKKNLIQKRALIYFNMAIIDVYQEIGGYKEIDGTCENNSKYKRVCLLNYIHDSDGKKG